MNVELSPKAVKLFERLDEPLVIETDLTDEEKEIIRQGEEDYKLGGYIPLCELEAKLKRGGGNS